MFTMSAVELASAIRNKRIGVEELTRAYLERIDKYDGADGLNTIDFELRCLKACVDTMPKL